MTQQEQALLARLRAENPSYHINDCFVECPRTRRREFYTLDVYHPLRVKGAIARLQAQEASVAP